MESSATSDEQPNPPPPSPPLQPPPPPPSMPTQPPEERKSSSRTTQVLVRSLASFATLAAALIMVLSEDTAVFGGFSMHADYKSSSAFKFFLIGNSIACGYSLLSSFFIRQTGSNCFVHLMDMFVMVLVMAAAASASAIGYLAKYGNSKIGWFEVCNYFDKYCSKVRISLVCSYVGFLLLYLVCAMTTLQKPKKNS